MWNSFTIVLIFSLFSIAFQTDYKVLKLEKCHGDNKSVIIEICNFMDGYLFNNKMNIIQPINFFVVSLIFVQKLVKVY